MNTATYIDQILGTTGRGKKLLEEWTDYPTLIQNLSASGLTEKQQARLQAAFALQLQGCVKPNISSPADCAALLQKYQAETQEHFVVLLLDRRNKVLKEVVVYKGTGYGINVRIGEIFREAIIHNASAIILGHNHPSGDPTPSSEDVALTRDCVQAGELLDISVLDHIVIGFGRWVSLKERGLGF